MEIKTQAEKIFLSAVEMLSEDEIRGFFKKHFHDPLDAQFMGKPEIPAEEIRHKRKQIQHVENVFISLKNVKNNS